MRMATVRASALGGWHDAIAGCGLDPMAMWRAAGLDSQVWTDPTAQITLKSFVCLSEIAGRMSGHNALPWLVGEQYDLRQLDDVGEAVTAATTLGTALQRLADHFSLLQDATEVRFVAGPDAATISYRILDPDIWPRHYDAQFSLGIITQIIKRAAGADWDRAELLFESETRDTRCDFTIAIGAPCIFGADTNEIRIPLAFLDLPMPPSGGHADLKNLSRKLVAKRRTMQTSDRVAAIVFRELNDGQFSQEQLASEIGMSSRTLRRKLAVEGRSFQDIVDDCRMRYAALDFRTRPELSIAQIALRLGYSEHSTFTRAFSRWSGMAPQTFRRQQMLELN